jgi:hypothetical protein
MLSLRIQVKSSRVRGLVRLTSVVADNHEAEMVAELELEDPDLEQGPEQEPEIAEVQDALRDAAGVQRRMVTVQVRGQIRWDVSGVHDVMKEIIVVILEAALRDLFQETQEVGLLEAHVKTGREIVSSGVKLT